MLFRSFSYPSGLTRATAVYLTLVIITSRRQRNSAVRVEIVAAMLVIIGLVGASRVYLGVHYPSDVASGMSLGAAWALLPAASFSLLGRHRS